MEILNIIPDFVAVSVGQFNFGWTLASFGTLATFDANGGRSFEESVFCGGTVETI